MKVGGTISTVEQIRNTLAGGRVFLSSMAELRDSRIADQTIVQAWDA
jgi:hypothetical protein